ncbi:MAG: DUF2207 domain-containing protein [Angustibacter sp.]
MIRWLLRVVLLGLLAVGIAASVVGSGDQADAQPEDTTISRYDASFTVSRDGRLDVVEQLDVDFPVTGKHGIFRFFDTRDAADPHARRVPLGVAVLRDGQPEPIQSSREGDGRYRVIRIGSPDRTLTPGTHRYEIRYHLEGVLSPPSDRSADGDASARFYWNLVPGGWQQPIRSSSLTVRLPAPAGQVRCAVGVGASGGCQADGAGTAQLRISTGPLPPRTPVTVSADLGVPSSSAQVPWSQRLDPVLGTRPWALALMVLLALGAGALGWLLSRSTRESRPRFPLQYAPPDGIGPAQAAYLLTERTDRNAFVASVMHAAERGAVTLERSASGWTITDRVGESGWAGLDEVTGRVAGLLAGPGTAFVVDRDDPQTGKVLASRIESAQDTTRVWARQAGLLTTAGPGSFGGVLVVGAVVATVVLCFANPLGMSVLAAVPGLFAIGGIEVLAPGASTRRTFIGRNMWSRIGGFRRVLSTPSSVARFDFAGREQLYTAYLPWAVAFDCAAAWAEKFRIETGAEPPVPSYVGGYGLVGGAGGVHGLVGDFSSSVSGAISSYQATQQSSSGGSGGGFSGGGGGGGGGGGSW